jgi:hypothetical protein
VSLIKEYRRQYYQKNKEKILKQCKEYRLKNPARVLQNKRKWNASLNGKKYNKEYSLRPEVKKHVRKMAKEWRLKNKEKMRAYHTKYQLENREHITEMRKKYYKKNKIYYIQKSRQWVLDNPERYQKRSKEYRLKTRDRRREYYLRPEVKERRRERYKIWTLENPDYKKEYLEKNNEHINKRRRLWTEKNREHISKKRKERRKNDPHFRLRMNLSKRVHEALKQNSKSANTMKLIGCTIEELWIHLESCKSWESWMTRENYGGGNWDVDHIKACAKFDLTYPEQQRECFHWSNLQPLEHIANLRKGAR